MKLRQIRHVILPSLIIVVILVLYACGQTIGYPYQKWDVITAVCFTALVVNVFLFPCLAISGVYRYLKASEENKLITRYSMIGFVLATFILFIGIRLLAFVTQSNFQT
jgi:hypothetical protein